MAVRIEDTGKQSRAGPICMPRTGTIVLQTIRKAHSVAAEKNPMQYSTNGCQPFGLFQVDSAWCSFHTS